MYIFRLAWIALDLLAQSTNMHINGPYITRVVIAPYCIEQMVSAVYFIGVQRHQLQQVKLLGCQIDLFSTNVESAAVTIQVKISLLHHAAWLLLRLFLLRPADDRFDPRFYFQILNGLVI